MLVSADRVAHGGIPEPCAAHLGQVAQAHRVERVAFAPGGGWALGSDTLREQFPGDPLCDFEEGLRLVNGRWRSLAERMAAHACDAAGLALAEGGRLRVATCHGALDPAAWRRVADGWLDGADVEAAGACALTVEAGGARALVLARGGQAPELAAEMAEAVERCWPAGATPAIR